MMKCLCSKLELLGTILSFYSLSSIVVPHENINSIKSMNRDCMFYAFFVSSHEYTMMMMNDEFSFSDNKHARE